MPHLAFYRAEHGALSDRVISWVTRSPFSHVEFLPDLPETRAISASSRDGGVRWRQISFHPDRWDIQEVPWAPPDAVARIEEHLDAPYDWLGLVFSQVLNLRRHRAGRWFCSELCAHALGMGSPHELSPGGLRTRILELNAAYEMGRASSGEPPEE